MLDYNYELILINESTQVKYFIDIFPENTIKSQEIALRIIDNYRNELPKEDNSSLKIVIRKINCNDDNGEKEYYLKIQDSILFSSENKDQMSLQGYDSSRNISIINEFEFSL